MCGHGAIGTVTVAIEHGLVEPETPGVLYLDTPAGKVKTRYEMDGKYVESVRLVNVPSYLEATDLPVECPELGPLTVDVAYGGNFYAIIDPQENYGGMQDLSVDQFLQWSPVIRRRLNEQHTFVHPNDETIRGLSHIEWAGAPTDGEADGRNVVFYGDRALDRSPCGTGTSARMAQKVMKGELDVGDTYVHESIIGSLFHGRVERRAQVGDKEAIVPSIKGWARVTGLNTIFIDDRDPFANGFQVT
jgi:4-hydroxyproline epimerase